MASVQYNMERPKMWIDLIVRVFAALLILLFLEWAFYELRRRGIRG